MNYDLTLPRRVDAAAVLNRMPRASFVQAELKPDTPEADGDPNDWWHQRRNKKQKTDPAGKADGEQ